MSALDLRGFTCAVSSIGTPGKPQPAGIAVGLDEEDGEQRYVVAIRHAGGEVLVAQLDDIGLDRLAVKLAGLVDRRPAAVREASEARLRMMLVETAARFGVPMAKVLGPERTQMLSRVRYAFVWVARHATPASYPQLGRTLGQADHTSAMAADRRGEELRVEDPEFRALTDALLAEWTQENPS